MLGNCMDQRLARQVENLEAKSKILTKLLKKRRRYGAKWDILLRQDLGWSNTRAAAGYPRMLMEASIRWLGAGMSRERAAAPAFCLPIWSSSIAQVSRW